MPQKNKSQTKEKQTQDTQYGLYLIVHGTATDTEVEKVHNEVCETITQKGGEIHQAEPCVKNNLAYPIQKSSFGHTTTIYFQSDPTSTSDIRESLKTFGFPLVRHLLTKEEYIPTPPTSQKDPTATTLESEADLSIAPLPSSPDPAPKPGDSSKKVTIEDIDKKLDEIMKTNL